MKNMVSTLTLFESIKHIDEDGNEYWLARELKNALDYAQWRRFSSVIDKAIISCKNSNISIDCNFAKVGKIVKTGISEKNIIDYKLSRYACYIIAQNSDSNKSVVALAQTYFAIQTTSAMRTTSLRSTKQRRRWNIQRTVKNMQVCR